MTAGFVSLVVLVAAGCSDDAASACPCESGMTCVNETCQANCSSHDECDGLCQGGVCTPVLECDAGYTDDGSACVDDDECSAELATADCDANATCTNTPGSFTCACNEGYSGDGQTCAMDEVSAVGAPRLINFRVTDVDPTRLYFDSTEQLLGSTVDGFTISGKSITSVTINGVGSTGHYFTASTAFSYWDNNTVRYEGGSDVRDSENNGVYEFTLTYVLNMISEPSADTIRYVSASASGGGNGNSEATAWTLAEFRTNAAAGMTVWMKAGDYGDVSLGALGADGTASEPIKLIGYTSSTGDITDYAVDTFTYTNNVQAQEVIDSSKYPVLSGTNRDASGFYLRDAHYWIIKNVQIERYKYGVLLYDASSNIVLENVVVSNAWIVSPDSGIGFMSGAIPGNNQRLFKCLSIDSASANIRLYGDFNLVRKSKAISGVFPENSTDYYISLYSSNNTIIVDSESIRVGEPTHKGHAMGIKGMGESSYCLFEGNLARNTSEGYFLAYESTHDNVVKNNQMLGDKDKQRIASALVNRDGAYSNVFENNRGEHVNSCISQWRSTEEAGFSTRHISLNNTFRNNVFDDYSTAMSCSNQHASPHKIENSRIYNNTFNNSSRAIFYYALTNNTEIQFINNEVRNNIFMTLTPTSDRFYYGDASESDYLQQYNSYVGIQASDYTKPPGTGNVELNPDFSDSANGDFHLKDTSPVKDLGVCLADVNYDRDGVERFADLCSIGAYEQD